MKGMSIGANFWLGAKNTFLDGSSIGDACVLAAEAVVTQPFLGDVVLGGVPARMLKQLDQSGTLTPFILPRTN